jgi:protein-disulfide isomerase
MLQLGVAVVSDISPVVAIIGGVKITQKSLDDEMSSFLNRLDESLYQEREKYLNSKLLDLEAGGNDVTISELLEKEVGQKIKMNDRAVRKYYEENMDRFQGRSFNEVIPQVRGMLRQQLGDALFITYINKLKRKYKASYTIPLFSYTSPVKKAAVVEIVEFSDFECGYCQNAHKYLKKLKKKYGDRINVVFKNYPLKFHKHAYLSAVAGECAKKQKAFGPYADLLFKNQKKLSKVKLFYFADKLHLDADMFKACMNDGSGDREVKADMAEGNKMRVSNTPTFFINGKRFEGLPPESIFNKYIEASLQKNR